MLGKWRAPARCNYNVASISPPPFFLLRFSRRISCSDRRQVLSRLPSQPPEHKPRDPASARLLSPHRGGEPYQAEKIANRWGRMTHKGTQTNIHLLRRHTLFRPTEGPGPNPRLLGGDPRCVCVCVSSFTKVVSGQRSGVKCFGQQNHKPRTGQQR